MQGQILLYIFLGLGWLAAPHATWTNAGLREHLSFGYEVLWPYIWDPKKQ